MTPTALTDGTRTVTASVTDPAGNQGTDSQTLIVDTTRTGGHDHRRGERADQRRDTDDLRNRGRRARHDRHRDPRRRDADRTVQTGGTWSVTAAFLSDGPHRVVMSVSDAAGNLASFTQTLTVDTVAPVVAITGGPTASDDRSPDRRSPEPPTPRPARSSP